MLSISLSIFVLSFLNQQSKPYKNPDSPSLHQSEKLIYHGKTDYEEKSPIIKPELPSTTHTTASI